MSPCVIAACLPLSVLLAFPPGLAALTATQTVTPTWTPGGARLIVRVAEFPAGCQGAMRGVTVELRPAGLVRVTSLTDGTVQFDVPPGRYTVVVPSGCNPFGCWPNRVVDLVPGPQSITLCPLAAPLPTPTPTPSPAPTGALGEKTTALHVFNLASGAPVAGAAVACTGPRQSDAGVTDDGGEFACTLTLRDSDTVLVVVEAPGFTARRRGYAGLDLWMNTQTLEVGLVPDDRCAGDCDGDGVITISDLVRIVARVLDDGSSRGCPLGDVDGDGRVAVNDVVGALGLAHDGCPSG